MSRQGNTRITETFKKIKHAKDSPSIKGNHDVKPSTSSAGEEKDFELLRQFDLNWEYGPCIGITRLERWQRAEKHGLNPAPAVKQLLQQHPKEEKYTHCVWNDYKNIM